MAKATINDLAVIMKKEFEKTNKEIGIIGSEMVTKSYLDEKLGDLRGDLVVLMRKEDNKLKMLIEILKERKLISVNDEKRILSMEPFPQLSLHLKTGA